jgi:hypothetical protein
MRITLAIALLLSPVSSAWAQFLPPEEFDRPFDGPTVFRIARDQDEVRRICKAAFNTG